MNILIVGALGTNGSRLKQLHRRGCRLTYLSTFYFVDSLWDFQDGTLTYEHFSSPEELADGDFFEQRVRNLVRRDSIDLIYCLLNYPDGSNEFTRRLIRMNLDIPIVRHYKEHRCQAEDLEREVLLGTRGQIYENTESVRYFKETYGVGNRFLVALGDPPQYASFVTETLPEPISGSGETIHVVSFTSNNTCEAKGPDYGRYSIEEIVEVLADGGIHVHIYGHMPLDCRAVYKTIQHRYPEYVHVYGFVDSRTTCNIVAAYDWGLVYSHPRRLWPFLETEQWHFNRLNSPGKMAQYIAAGVPFFLKRGIYDFMERVVMENGFGFVFDDYDSLILQLKDRSAWAYYRENLRQHKFRFSMEAQADSMLHFFQQFV